MFQDFHGSNPPIDHVPETPPLKPHPIKRGLAAALVVVAVAASGYFAWPFLLVLLLIWLWWELLQWAIQ